MCVTGPDDSAPRRRRGSGSPCSAERPTPSRSWTAWGGGRRRGERPTLAGQTLRRLGWALEQRNVDLLIDPGIIEVAGPRLSSAGHGLPMLHVERPVCSGVRYAAKLTVDRLRRPSRPPRRRTPPCPPWPLVPARPGPRSTASAGSGKTGRPSPCEVPHHGARRGGEAGALEIGHEVNEVLFKLQS